jgi:sigma-B regulation protein RsbU (phosphoserine phosphatase)
MNRPKRIVWITWWILRAMFLKLTVWRRFLFVVGLVSIFNVRVHGNDVTIEGNIMLGTAALILIILLELKDKLLAHDELAEGRKIQQALMPKENPQIPGWSVWLYTRAANEVCGDLIDVLHLDNNRFGITIADVAGKGLHAALLTTKLQATLRALAYDESSLSALVMRINTIFHRDSPTNMFASMFYCEVTANSGTIRFVNAGHFPALVVRNTIPEETPKGDPALGLTRTVQYNEHNSIITSGDVFILYSDGLTEAKNDLGEFFGKERLIRFFSNNTRTEPSHIGMALLTEIDRFTKTQKSADDLSLIILRKN